MSTWEHFVAILLGQYSNCESLRDIVETINFHSVEHYHLSLKQSICRSTLSDANRNRDWRIFRDLFLYLISDMQQKDILDSKEVNFDDYQNFLEKQTRFNAIKKINPSEADKLLEYNILEAKKRFYYYESLSRK